MKNGSNPLGVFAVAISEWLLVLPPALLLAAAALRQLQPTQHEPARTLSLIFEKLGPHISHSVAALLFLALPGIAVAVGCIALLQVWRASETLRQDTNAVLASLRRHLPIAILGTGTILAAAILAAVVVHIITD